MGFGPLNRIIEAIAYKYAPALYGFTIGVGKYG